MQQTKQRRMRPWLAGRVIVPLALFSAYTRVVLNGSYSSGERAS